ncbi:MAG TPA: hypothetical protein VMG34_08155 [Bacteroidota bacterium]|nr:hypothetical protein [Bacteroidota bacterium]
MKRATVLLFGLFLTLSIVASNASAQGMMRATPEERAKSLKDSLGLNDKQTDSVIAIFKAMNVKRQAAMDSVDDRDARRDVMMKLMSETDEKIEALLTPDQKTKYEAMKQERMARFRRPQN